MSLEMEVHCSKEARSEPQQKGDVRYPRSRTQFPLRQFREAPWISSKGEGRGGKPPTTRREAIARVNLLDFRVNARQKWTLQDVEYRRGTPRPGLVSAISPREI